VWQANSEAQHVDRNHSTATSTQGGLRYTSDMTDAEWAVIAPRLPEPKQLGRPRGTELRAVVNALFYMARTGCQWKPLPSDFPHYSTVQYYFYSWRDNGVLERINFELLLQSREAAGREVSPAGVIDRQSVKTTESNGSTDTSPTPSLVFATKWSDVVDTAGLRWHTLDHFAQNQ
jgi:transposase